MSGIEYSFGSNTKATTESMVGGGEDSKVVSKSSAPVELDFEEKSKDASADTAPVAADVQTPGSDTKQDVDGAGKSDEGDQGQDAPTELKSPEKFDPSDEANVAEWNKEYTTSDGELNLDRLSAEFEVNYKDGSGEPTLNEATFAFLKSKGISKATVEKVIAAQLNARAYEKTERSRQDNELAQMAGGPDNLKSALDWGNGGGYSETQRKQFDNIMSGSDMEAKKDAIELLMMRYSKSNPVDTKPREPKRDATNGEGKPGLQAAPFKNRAEWRAARKAAAGDLEKMRLVDMRAKAAGF